MKDTDYMDKKESDAKQITNELPNKLLHPCRNKVLKSVDSNGPYESLFQNDEQRVIVEYFFGNSNSRTKSLYYQIMNKPRMYG
jgi:hypothetical protein